MARSRANRTAAKKKIDQKKNSEAMSAKRAAETEEEKAERNRVNAERQATMRANMTPDQQLNERNAARARMAAVRNYTTADSMDATKTEEILQGTFVIHKLEDSVDTIGTMTVSCRFCGAMKFPKEISRTTTCCSDGKVKLDPFPRPPENLMNLWIGSDAKSRLFRKHSRQLNNALCLSSLKVSVRDMGGFNPSVVFQGRGV